MKYFILIILILSSNTIRAQLDYVEGASPGVINWSDPVYDDLFNGSCGMNLKMEKSAKLGNLLTRFYQTGQSWSETPYGVVSDNCGTIGTQGCYLTCLAMMLSTCGDYIDPFHLNEFVFSDATRHSGCNLIADKILSSRSLHTLIENHRDYTQSVSDDINSRIKSILNNNGFVAAHVNGCGHFILIYDWANIGGKDIFYTADPVQSVTKTDLSQYNYCDFRYYLPTENAMAPEMTVNGILPSNKVVTITSGSVLNFGLNWLKNATIAQNSTTGCTKRLWVVKDDYGKVIDKLADSDTYTFSQYTYGRYYVSYAVSNENGFEGKTVEVIVGDGSSNEPIVVDGGSVCSDVPPTCGDGKCDPKEGDCIKCNGDCGHQYVDKGFRINDSFDDVVYLCSKNFTITPIKGSFYCGTETEHHFCWLSLLTWTNCPYFYSNYYVDVIECNNDRTEKSKVFTYSNRFELDNDNYWHTDKYFNRLSFSDIDYNFLEATYYKIVLKTYFDGTNSKDPQGWISSYKYIYILPPNTFSNLISGQTYLQTDIVFQNQRLARSLVNNTGKYRIIAKNSIKIEPDTYISANSNFSIDPTLSINCSTVKSAKIDTSYVSSKSDKPVNLIHNINPLEITEESNLSIYPNPNDGSFTALLKNDTVREILIINMYGQEVCFNASKISDNSFSVCLLNCLNGTYIVRVKGKQKTYTQKIIVKN